MENARPPLLRQILFGILFFLIVATIAFAGSLASVSNVDGWYANAAKVAWDPPNSVFGPVWSILYFLIAVAGFLIWRSGYRTYGRNEARGTLTIYAAQLVLNALWTPTFFAGYPLMGEIAWWLAAAIIVALMVVVVLLAASTRRWSKIAAWIMVPYLLWLLFATTLNIGIIILN